MTQVERTRATLNAATTGRKMTHGIEPFVLPLKHVEEHFVRWCFMVRHPWSAEPVRGVWFDCLRSRLYVEKYSFRPSLVQYKHADDLAALGASVATFTDGYAVGAMWGPSAFIDTAAAGSARNGWFARRMPMISYQGNLKDVANVNQAPLGSTNKLCLGSPQTALDYTTNYRYLTPLCITGNYGGNAAEPSSLSGTGPLYRGASWAKDGRSEGSSYRAVAAGMKIYFLSSAETRKGQIFFLETSNHRTLDYTATPPYLADIVTGTSNVARYTGVRRYPLAGNTEGFHQVWHPLALADHQWLSCGDAGGPYVNAGGVASEDLNYPGPSSVSGTSSDTSEGYTNPCLWAATGIDVTEQVVCEFVQIYEMVNDANDGEDYSVMIDAAPRAAAKMCEQYSDAVAHHVGSSGAELRTTSEVATSELL